MLPKLPPHPCSALVGVVRGGHFALVEHFPRQGMRHVQPRLKKKQKRTHSTPESPEVPGSVGAAVRATSERSGVVPSHGRSRAVHRRRRPRCFSRKAGGAAEEAGAPWPGDVHHPGEREPLSGERCSSAVDPATTPPEVVAAVTEAWAARTGFGPIMPPPKAVADVIEAVPARTGVGSAPLPPPNIVAAVTEAGAACTGVGPAMPPPQVVAAVIEASPARTGVGSPVPPPEDVAAVTEAGAA